MYGLRYSFVNGAYKLKIELKQGITNAHTLLREDGKLIIRSLSRPAADEIGTTKLTEWAYESGFEEKHAVHFEAGIYQLGSLIVTGHFGAREIQTVVLTKKNTVFCDEIQRIAIIFV